VYLFYQRRQMTIAQKLNPTNRYKTLKGPTVPWGYEIHNIDPHLLEPIEEQLEALSMAEDYLKESSYPEVSRWLTEYTGRSITPMGLWKRIKTDKTDRRKHAEQKSRTAKTQAEGNIYAQA